MCGLGVAIETASPQSYAMALAILALRFEDLLAALRQTRSEIESALSAIRTAKAVVESQ